MSGNKHKLNQLKQIYGNKCMFTGVKKELTFHHIEKECDGGERSIENGAILSSLSQEWLHLDIEPNDPQLYDLCNECLILYKKVIELNNIELIKLYREDIIPIYRTLIYNNAIKQHKQFDHRVKEVKKLILTYNNEDKGVIR